MFSLVYVTRDGIPGFIGFATASERTQWLMPRLSQLLHFHLNKSPRR